MARVDVSAHWQQQSAEPEGDGLQLQHAENYRCCIGMVSGIYTIHIEKGIQGRSQRFNMSGVSQIYNQPSDPVVIGLISHQIRAVDAHYDSFLSSFLFIEYQIRTSSIGATNPVQHFSWVKYNGA